MKTFNDLTGLYSLSKTLRFELKPVGKTKENIETKGIIAQDEKRAEEYKKVKDIIDRYHKSFIDMCLAGLVLRTTSDGNNDSLEDYVALASKSNRDEKEEKDFDGVKTALRKQIVDAFKKGGVEAAKDVCRDTRGPVARMYYDALMHYDEGVDVVEKHLINAGNVEQSRLENGLNWISLFIAIAPSLGFLGTVIGMIQAFDAIQAAGDISPNVVAGGMKVALITTVGGLIVAMILQVFYNYILAKIESINIDMEESSIDLVDILAKNK